MSIRVVQHGIVYRNPRPELRAQHAWHPSLVDVGQHRWLCSFDLGSAPESIDYATYLSRSDDDGITWTDPVRLLHDASGRRTTHTIRIARMRDGRIVGAGARLFRDDPERGLINTPGLGYAPMELISMTSRDGGWSWSDVATVSPPLVGPCFETCHSLVELDDGRLLWPTSTWMGWNGEAPNGMKAIALVSENDGATWSKYMDIFDRWSEGVLHWEVSVVEMANGSLLAVAWAVDTRDSQTKPTPYALSGDGMTFSRRGVTGIRAQTAKLVALPTGQALCAFRRHDTPGLWACIVSIDPEGTWTNSDQVALWLGAPSGMQGRGRSVGEDLSALAFGYPNLHLRDDGDVMLAFWCREDCLGGIRWMRLAVS